MNYTDNLPSNSTSTNKKVVFMHNLANISLQRNIKERHAQQHASRPSFWRKTLDKKSATGHFRVASSLCFKARIDLTRRTTTIYNFELTSTELRRSRTLLEISGCNAMQLSQTGRLFDLWRKQIKNWRRAFHAWSASERASESSLRAGSYHTRPENHTNDFEKVYW